MPYSYNAHKKSSIIQFCMLVTFIFFLNQNMWAQKKDFNVYAVNYPLSYMTQTISGGLVNVHFDVPNGQDPAYWKPSSQELAKIQQCDLIVLNGANYAKWVQKYSLPRMKLVNSMKNSKDAFVYSGESVTHSHGSNGAHSHESLAFTTWLDFKITQQQAEVIYNSLCKKLPDHESEFKGNYNDLIQNLNKLDQELVKVTSAIKGKSILASHPVYDYFAKAYDIDIHSVHWEAKSYPSPSEWSKIKSLKEKTGATLMLWEAAPLDDIISRLHSIGIQVIVFDTSANTPSSGDFVSVMNENVANIKNSL